jgi:hypothetical protein
MIGLPDNIRYDARLYQSASLLKQRDKEFIFKALDAAKEEWYQCSGETEELRWFQKWFGGGGWGYD